MPSIILSEELENILSNEIKCCTLDLNIVSGFCKLSTLKFIDENISGSIRKRLLVRFLPSDLASGSTDKEIFKYCKENNWELFIDYSIHAKTYVFDKIKCIIGSANATNRGIGISDNHNKEASSYFTLSEDDYLKVMTLYKDAIILTDDIYREITDSLDDTMAKKCIDNNRKIEVNIGCLMPEDFPDKNTDIVELYSLKSYKWLIYYLKTKANQSAFFGELTEKIHNIFVKDPRPYRKDIKDHLVDLLDAIKRLKPEGIAITRPNYSECVELTM